MPQRPLWTAPLGLRESAVFTVLLLLTGFALQLAAGPFSCYILGFPANLAVLCALLAAGLLAGYRTDCALCAWISGSAFATALLAGMTEAGALRSQNAASGRLCAS